MSSSVFPVPFSGIQETLIDAKGDLIVGNAADTPARLAVGSNNQVLTADSSVTGGIKWATPATPTFVGAAAYNNNASTTFTSGTAVTIPLDAESFDTNSFHDNSTNNTRFTIPAGYGGKYMVIAHWDMNGINSYYLGQIRKNGSVAVNGTNRQWAQTAGGNNFAAGDAVIIDTAVAGDYYEMTMQLGQTGTLTSNYYRLQIVYLGA